MASKVKAVKMGTDFCIEISDNGLLSVFLCYCIVILECSLLILLLLFNGGGVQTTQDNIQGY
jgi:hypothetical protein